MFVLKPRFLKLIETGTPNKLEFVRQTPPPSPQFRMNETSDFIGVYL